MHNKLIVVLIGLTLFLGGGTAGAGEKQRSCYRLISGKDNPVCKLFLQNLNRFCRKQSLVCEPQIHSDFSKYFSVPKWGTVDYKSHLDIVEQYIKIRAIIPINCSGQCVTDTQEKRWQEYKAELLPRLESGQIKLVRARVHIRFDDKPRIAYKLVETICSPDDLKTLLVSWKPGLIIVDEDTGRPNVYYSKTPKLLGHSDVIIYGGNAYLLALEESLRFADLYNQSSIECNYLYTGKIGGKK
jgi:hypothetical protein